MSATFEQAQLWTVGVDDVSEYHGTLEDWIAATGERIFHELDGYRAITGEQAGKAAHAVTEALRAALAQHADD